MEFVCFKWKPAHTYRSTFSHDAVNTLWSMLARNFNGPCRLTCITDDPKGISSEVRVLPLWDTYGSLPSPHGHAYPSCYRRLRLFAPDAAELIGPRFAVMDLDIVVTADITPLFPADVDFKIWGDTAKGTPYNGSLWMMNAGARRQVWDEFDPIASPRKSLALGYIGSDQGWIGACLGPNEQKWSIRDGVYSFRNHIQKSAYQLPANARMVIFHGAWDPWTQTAQRLSWVRKHYR